MEEQWKNHHGLPLREINYNAQLVVDTISDILKLHYDLGQASQHSGRKLTDSE